MSGGKDSHRQLLPRSGWVRRRHRRVPRASVRGVTDLRGPLRGPVGPLLGVRHDRERYRAVQPL